MSTALPPDALPAHPLATDILDLFAREARIERALLQPDARPDELGVGSLDLTLALFALEDRYDIALTDALGSGGPLPTVGELVQRVLDAIAQKAATGAPQ